jgi:hypothetical protein
MVSRRKYRLISPSRFINFKGCTPHCHKNTQVALSENFSSFRTSTYKNYEQKLPKNLPLRTTTAMNRASRKPPNIYEKIYENYKFKKPKTAYSNKFCLKGS